MRLFGPVFVWSLRILNGGNFGDQESIFGDQISWTCMSRRNLPKSGILFLRRLIVLRNGKIRLIIEKISILFYSGKFCRSWTVFRFLYGHTLYLLSFSPFSQMIHWISLLSFFTNKLVQSGKSTFRLLSNNAHRFTISIWEHAYRDVIILISGLFYVICDFFKHYGNSTFAACSESINKSALPIRFLRGHVVQISLI